MRSQPRLFISTQPATTAEKWLALIVVLVSAALVLAAAPVAAWRLAPVHGFVPAHASALLICDLITAALLFSQFHTLRTLPLLALAGGYVFTGLIALVHALTFPTAFSATGLIGAGPQSAAWLYVFWHVGFPFFVIVYALTENNRSWAKDAKGASAWFREWPGITLGASVAGVSLLVAMLTLVATASSVSLPAIIADARFTFRANVAMSALWIPSLAALALLWRRRPHTALDLWLIVVLCAWIFDVALSAVLNAGRYDLGWYAGRIYGLIAGSVLLIALVIENGVHFGHLARLSAKLTTANAALEQLSLHDALTGLANRRYFDVHLWEQIAIARRHNRDAALVLCDVDHFKAFNTAHGHQAGDECLKRVAGALRSCCHRPADMAARYGGEEFALILPDTDSSGALRIAEAARAAVAQLRMPLGAGAAEVRVTISGGVAMLTPQTDAQQLISLADEGLFQAKHRGRDRIVCARPSRADARPPEAVTRAVRALPLARDAGRSRR